MESTSEDELFDFSDADVDTTRQHSIHQQSQHEVSDNSLQHGVAAGASCRVEPRSSRKRSAPPATQTVQTLTVTQAPEADGLGLGVSDDEITGQHLVPCASPAVDHRSQLSLTPTQPFTGASSSPQRPPSFGRVTANDEPASSDSGIDSEDEDVAALFRAENTARTQPAHAASLQSDTRATEVEQQASFDAKPEPAESDSAPGIDLAPALRAFGSGVLKRKSSAEQQTTYSGINLHHRAPSVAPQQFSQSRISQQQQQPQKRMSLSQDGANGHSGRKKARISPEKLPVQPFRLVMNKHISSQANVGCPRLRSLLNLNGMNDAILSNFMYDFSFLMRECPYLDKLRRFTVICHAKEPGDLGLLEASKPLNATLHAPHLPVPFGTMHSKCALLFSPTKLRVMITTANFISIDWQNKSQAVWNQDFPLKSTCDYDGDRSSGDFEDSLVAYFEVVGGFDVAALRKFDFSAARGRLVASVPGYHKGSSINKWGHMRLRALLQDVVVAPRFDTVVSQFSSMGSVATAHSYAQPRAHFQLFQGLNVSEKWIRQNWLPSVSSCRPTGGTRPAPAKLQLVIPTEAEVRNSNEGWFAGQAIPIRRKNHQPYMRKWKEPLSFTDHGFAVNHGQTVDLYHRWSSKDSASLDVGIDDGCSGRARAMPHIKTFARYSSIPNGQQPSEIAWVLISSHNFGPSPWGDLQKAQTQLMIRSYELGILVTPGTELNTHKAMGATDVTSVRLLHGSGDRSGFAGRSCNTSGSVDVGSRETISWIPLPYELPPAPYRQEDIPWANDIEHYQPDHLGYTFVPGQKLVTSTDQHVHNRPPVNDRGATATGASVHEQQYRQQQLQRQRQQKVRQQPTAQSSQQRGCDGGSSMRRDSSSNDSSAGGPTPAQWWWKAGTGWQAYDGRTTAALERSHAQFFACKQEGTDSGPFVAVEVGGGRHVDLTTMLQIVTAAPGRTRHVRRRGPAPHTSGRVAVGKPIHSRDMWI